MSQLFLSGTSAPEAAAGSLARHRVRDGIQQLILSGEYRPGQPLRQQALAARFDVTQGVVREALLELQFCGLVQAIDNLGMFVSGLKLDDLLDAYRIREMLEGLAARLCCQHASRADLGDLQELAEQVRALGRTGDHEAMGAADRQFHYRMIVASQNRLLAKLTAGYRVLGMFVRADRQRKEVDAEHLAILRAIEANQPDEAEALARRHVALSRQAIERQADGAFVPQFVREFKPGAEQADGGKPTAKNRSRRGKASSLRRK